MKRLVYSVLLAHHRRDEIHRCLKLPWGQTQLAVCARCVGFYPALLGAVVLQALLQIRSWGIWDWWVVFAGQAPVLVDWSIGRLDSRSGSNARRIVTGVVGGAALGRSFYLYFRDTRNEVFWANLLLIAFVAASAEVVRLLRLSNLQ